MFGYFIKGNRCDSYVKQKRHNAQFVFSLLDCPKPCTPNACWSDNFRKETQGKPSSQKRNSAAHKSYPEKNSPGAVEPDVPHDLISPKDFDEMDREEQQGWQKLKSKLRETKWAWEVAEDPSRCSLAFGFYYVEIAYASSRLLKDALLIREATQQICI